MIGAPVPETPPDLYWIQSIATEREQPVSVEGGLVQLTANRSPQIAFPVTSRLHGLILLFAYVLLVPISTAGFCAMEESVLVL